jgi:hypothetical protein
MSLTVVVQETALRTLARIRTEDKAAFVAIRQALSAPSSEGTGVGSRARVDNGDETS